jgi:hypothetical protein
MAGEAWRKSTRSNDSNNCVEIGQDLKNILVRDTKNRTGAVLKFSANSWNGFLASHGRQFPHK